MQSPQPTLKKTFDHIEELWNSTEYKLAVQVVGVKDLIESPGSLYCKLTWGKQSQQTSTRSNTVTGGWNDYFVFAVNTIAPFKISIKMKKAVPVPVGTPCGHCIIVSEESWTGSNFQELEGALETPVDKWYDVDTYSEKGCKGKSGGKLHIRLLLSKYNETRLTPLDSVPGSQQIVGKSLNLSKMKTGDLIVYSGIGYIPTYTKLQSNSPYSNVGMVFVLRNKYSMQKEHYVLEITRNTDNFPDAFWERPKAGISLFRLVERIHQFYGLQIWWVANNQITQKERKALVEHMWNNFHLKNDWMAKSLTKGEKCLIPDTLYRPLDNLGLFKFPRHREDLMEFLSAELVYNLLASSMNVLQKKETILDVLSVPDLLKFDCFSQPSMNMILLRDVDLSVAVKPQKLPEIYYTRQQKDIKDNIFASQSTSAED